MRARGGFTLLELLLVCAIIGILGGVGILNLRNAIDQSRLRDGASQFAASLQRARSSAQRYNRDSVLTLVGTSTTATSYTLRVNGQTAQQAVTYRLPQGVQITSPSTATKTITYTAPFGEVTAAASVAQYTVGLSGKDNKLYVKLIGLTGKVYQSAKPND